MVMVVVVVLVVWLLCDYVFHVQVVVKMVILQVSPADSGRYVCSSGGRVQWVDLAVQESKCWQGALYMVQGAGCRVQTWKMSEILPGRDFSFPDFTRSA